MALTTIRAASWCNGFIKKLEVSGTMALGTSSNTLCRLRSHLVPRSRVNPIFEAQSSGNGPAAEIAPVSPSTFSSVKSGGTLFAQVWAQTSSSAAAGELAKYTTG